MREYSLKIAETIKQFLEDDDWKYDFDEENGVIYTGLKLDCKFQRVDIMFRVHNDTFTSIFTLPLKTDEEARLKVAEFLTRANFGMIRGGFEMDFSDGEIRFRSAHYCGSNNDLVDPDCVHEVIGLSYTIIERYGNELMAVMMGFMEPEEAAEKADNK